MKKRVRLLLALIVCAAMLYAGLTEPLATTVSAVVKTDGTIDLQKKALVIPKGKKTAIKGRTLTMVKNRRYQVKAKFGKTTVSKTGTYKSSKPAVATVSSTGLVTAKAPGTATIKVTYNGKSQSFKVKVIASHKHAWKTTRKATCAVKGKKLCQTCGATGTTAMKTTHTFKTTKKATCEKSGTQTCTVCGTTAKIAKTSHAWQTDTWESIEGRGKPYYVTTLICTGCHTDMTEWTIEQIDAHQIDPNNIQCFLANITGAAGVTRYPKYCMVKETEITCKTCGAWKDKFQEDLYECDINGNALTESDSVKATQSTKTSNNSIIVTDDNVVDTNTDADVIVNPDEIIVDKPVISDNNVVSENNTDITAPEGDSDIVFEDDDIDDDEDTEGDGVLIIEDDDEEVIEDE